VQDRDRRDPDFFTHYDGPGSLIDDDSRGAVSVHGKLLDLRHELDRFGAVGRGRFDANETRILGMRNRSFTRPKSFVDGYNYSGGGCKVGLPEL